MLPAINAKNLAGLAAPDLNYVGGPVVYDGDLLPSGGGADVKLAKSYTGNSPDSAMQFLVHQLVRELDSAEMQFQTVLLLRRELDDHRFRIPHLIDRGEIGK